MRSFSGSILRDSADRPDHWPWDWPQVAVYLGWHHSQGEVVPQWGGANQGQPARRGYEPVHRRADGACHYEGEGEWQWHVPVRGLQHVRLTVQFRPTQGSLWVNTCGLCVSVITVRHGEAVSFRGMRSRHLSLCSPVVFPYSWAVVLGPPGGEVGKKTSQVWARFKMATL